MKLFKKISAAILAGVMALSMVACSATGTTTEKLEEEIKNPSTPATTAVLAALNLNLKEGVDPIANDATLAKKAQVYLDTVIANADKEVAGVNSWNKDFTVAGYSTTAVKQALVTADVKYKNEKIYTLNTATANDGVQLPDNVVWTLTANSVFKRNSDTIEKLATLGESLEKTGKKVGVATKEAHGNTYFIILLEA